MNIHLHIPITPLKRQGARPRVGSNVSTLAYSNIHVLKAPRAIISRTAHGAPSSNSKDEGRLQTEPACGAFSAEAELTDTPFSAHSPSLKAQKKQYLKLFTTASTDQQAQCSQHASNESIRGSQQSEGLGRSPSGKASKGSEEDGKPPRKLSPRRRLFGGIIIEREERIHLDQLDNEHAAYGKEGKEQARIITPKECSFLPARQQGFEQAQRNAELSAPYHLPSDPAAHFRHRPPLEVSREPGAQVEEVKRAGLALIRRIEEQAGGLSGLGDHCSAFLKECELAWSAGRPSEIYSFKLRELHASSSRLAACMEDVLRLNRLLSLRYPSPHARP